MMQAHKIDMLPYILSKRDLPPKILQVYVSPSLGILLDITFLYALLGRRILEF